MQSLSRKIVVLATGGTIAGRAASAHDNVGYQAAELGVDALLHGLRVPNDAELEAEQVAQLDSKDMDGPTWQRLAERVHHHLQRPEVQGLVITHGTDTLEETAWLLQRVLAPAKPVVLTAAMRPATSLQADGPQNLADALIVAATPGAQGVVVVMAGQVHGAADIRKQHSLRLDAFDSGDAGPIGRVTAGALTRWRMWPAGEALGLQLLQSQVADWPWVEIVTSHGGACGLGVDALVAAGVQGLVVAGTGNGSLHRDLEAALRRARQGAVAVRVVSRCAAGPVIGSDRSAWTIYPELGAPKARVELLLELLAARAGVREEPDAAARP